MKFTFFTIKYAFKSLARRPKKNIAAIFSVTLAVTLIVGVAAGSNGVKTALGYSVWNSNGKTDITITNPSFPYFPQNITNLITQSNDLRLATLNSISPVINYHSQVVYSKGLIENNVNLVGILPQITGFGNFYNMRGEKLDITKLLSSNLSNVTVIVSNTLANKMELKVNSIIQTSIPDGHGNSVALKAKVSAIYDGSKDRGLEYQFNPDSRIYIHLNQLQKRLVPNLQETITSLNINLKSVAQGGYVDRSIRNLNINDETFPGINEIQQAVNALSEIVHIQNKNLVVSSDRINVVKTIKDTVSSITSVLNIFAFMLITTALLLIINVQAMSFEDRQYQTSVLRAMGTSRSQIFRIFIVEALVVGIFGSILGLIVGMFYGNFIQYTLNNIFELPISNTSPQINQGTIVFAIIFGTLLSIFTASFPAYKASGKSIANELRGIQEIKTKKKGYKTLVIGLILSILGLVFAKNVGNFWTKQGWSTFDNMASIMLSLGLTLGGIGLLLTIVLPRRLALNISALSFWGFANFTMFEAIGWVKSGSPNNFLVLLLFYLILGTSMLAIVNFETIMRGINKLFFFIPSARGISQTTITGLISKKGRATLVFTIFTIIITLNVFLASISHTMQTNLVDKYQWRTYGNNIVVNSVTPSNNITSVISKIDGVQQVFAFRSAWLPVFVDQYPSANNSQFDPSVNIMYRQIIVLKRSIINPDGNWDSKSYPISFEAIDKNLGYNWKLDMTPQEQKSLSIQVLNDLFNGKTLDTTVNYKDINGTNIHFHMKQEIALGNAFSNLDSNLYLQTKDKNNPILAFKTITQSDDFLGGCSGFGCSILVSPKIANKLEVFDHVTEPNLFLVKTNKAYKDEKGNSAIANEIESKLNNLDDPSSLSSQMGVLIGATTRVIYTEMHNFWIQQSSVWEFFTTFATIGLLLGSAGMIIIAIRSVSERNREIGMMRAIGFSRKSVVYSVIYEMITLGLFGLVTGFLNGMLLEKMFAEKVMKVPASYPMGTLGFYSAVVLGVALIAAIIPGIKAARVPPSQALRYTG